MDYSIFSSKALGALASQLSVSMQSALRHRELSENQIEQLTPQEAFEQFCQWHGLINWSSTLWQQVVALHALENQITGQAPGQMAPSVEPMQVIVFIEGGVVEAVAERCQPQGGVRCLVVDYDNMPAPSPEMALSEDEQAMAFERDRLGCTRDELVQSGASFIW